MKLVFPEILYVAVFLILMILETESMIKDEITSMANERYLGITLGEVILTHISYARDLEMSKLTEEKLSGNKPKVGKVKVKNEEFEKCKQEGKCFKCFKEGLDGKYKECIKHNKNLNLVSTKQYNDYLNACEVTMNMSQEDKYKEALSYSENFDGQNDVKVYKIASVKLRLPH